jgi:hypothetical protein
MRMLVMIDPALPTLVVVPLIQNSTPLEPNLFSLYALTINNDKPVIAKMALGDPVSQFVEFTKLNSLSRSIVNF